MGQQGLAQVLVRAAGLLIVATAVLNAPYEAAKVLQSHKEPFQDPWKTAEIIEFWGAIIAPAAISVVFGATIFWCAGFITERALAPAQTESGREAMDATILERAAVVGVGFYFLADGVAFGVRDVAAITLIPFMERDYGIIPGSMKLNVFGDVVRIVVGAVLVFQAHRLVEFRRAFAARSTS